MGDESWMERSSPDDFAADREPMGQIMQQPLDPVREKLEKILEQLEIGYDASGRLVQSMNISEDFLGEMIPSERSYYKSLVQQFQETHEGYGFAMALIYDSFPELRPIEFPKEKAPGAW